MRALLLAAALAAGLAAPSLAQSTDNTRAFSERLARSFVESGVGAMLDLMIEETALGENRGARQNIIDQRARWIRQVEGLGSPLAWEYAGVRSYAPSLRTECWVVKYRQQPLLVSFRFYRFETGWDLINYAWTSQDNLKDWECAVGTVGSAGAAAP